MKEIKIKQNISKFFYKKIYQYSYQNHFSFIAYCKPQDKSEDGIDILAEKLAEKKKEEKKSHQFPLPTSSLKGNILISLQDLQVKPYLQFKEFSPDFPSFLFSPFTYPAYPNYQESKTSSSQFSSRFSSLKKLSFYSVDIIINVDTKKIIFKENPKVRSVVKAILKILQTQDELFSKKTIYYFLPDSKNLRMKKNNFIQLITEKIELMNRKNKKLIKLVLSNIKWKAKPKSFELFDFFLKCQETNPTALVSLVSSPQVGTWIGASPEILVSKDKRKIFKTVSLAGTQWIKDKNFSTSNQFDLSHLYRIPWTQKEIEEQAIISRYIIDCFKVLRLREYIEEGPQTIKIGKLLHLMTVFIVNLKKYYGGSLPYEMIRLLHPTPAICGVPKEKSIREIIASELHDRRYYSGFLGPIEIDTCIDIYVNLRCGELFNNRFCFYAGAGITKHSEPHLEWQEVEAKLNVLINNLNALYG